MLTGPLALKIIYDNEGRYHCLQEIKLELYLKDVFTVYRDVNKRIGVTWPLEGPLVESCSFGIEGWWRKYVCGGRYSGLFF